MKVLVCLLSYLSVCPPVCLQLFDLIYREETLFNVIKSVTRNGRSILLTALLALILVYLFSIVGFLCLKEDFIMEVDPLARIAAGNVTRLIPEHVRGLIVKPAQGPELTSFLRFSESCRCSLSVK